MAYGTPADPVANTVITVAYAVSNILDPIRWLRRMTGNADPPGSNHWLRSTSTTGVAWVQREQEVRDAIAPTLVLPTAVGDKVSLYGGFAGISVQTGKAILYKAGGIEWYISNQIDGAGAARIYHQGFQGAGSGLDADRLEGQEGTYYATAASVAAINQVPSGLIAAFPAAAAIAAGWTRFTAGNGRFLVGAGTTFGQAFVEGASAGSSWDHLHSASGNTGNPTPAGGAVTAGGGSTAAPAPHTHPWSANTDNARWLPPSFTVVWAQKS